jgi:hypothetical protein
VAFENSTYTTGRRGVAGTLIVKKMVGAAAGIGTPETAFKQRRCSSCTPSDASKSGPLAQINFDELRRALSFATICAASTCGRAGAFCRMRSNERPRHCGGAVHLEELMRRISSSRMKFPCYCMKIPWYSKYFPC